MLKRCFLIGVAVLICTSLGFAHWKAPVNLGDTINSSSDEVRAVFFLDDSTLYFSSNRPGGEGKMDIWSSVKDSNGWQAPQNMGPPINTDSDDWLPCFSSDGDTMYFISDRPPSQDNDIWKTWKKGGDWQPPVLLGSPVNSDASE